ncbi:flagellin [Pleomorphomonas koreensis]|uniref:flagellin N-terminal helical domain-containing protein n=1 Tax=Pleomorphomonas koreensis TaxID=257440 RepID=UPI0003F5EC7D|nr:flagellin [Pleomorphomonas koreensis]
MSDINLTKAVRQNLLTLQGTAKMMATTQNRLATGNKVNSALDNPSNFFTASSLNSRASDLSNLMDSMASGIKTIEAADNGLSSITKTLESMQSTLRQARQDKSFETASYTLGTATDYANDQISFTGGAFGAGGKGTVKLMTDSAQSATGAASYAAPTAAANASLTGAASLASPIDFSASSGANAGSLKFTYGGVTATAAFTTSDTAASGSDIVTRVQAAIDATALNGKLTASLDSSNHLVVKANDQDDGKAVTTTGSTAATLTAVMGSPTSVTGSDGKNTFSVNGVEVNLTADDSTVAKAVSTINTQLSNAGSKFKAVEDSGKLKIQANDSTAGKLKITGADASLFGAASDDATIHLAKTTDQLVNEINNNSGLSSKIKASNDNGKLRLQNLSTQDLSIDGVTSSGEIDGTSAGAAKIDGNSVRTGFADQFNELRDQLDKLADDASFNGINLLRGDKLKITFNETGASSIDIQAKDGKSVDSTSLGVPTTLKAQDLDSDDTIDGFLDQVKAGLNKVRSQSSAFGSNLSVVENRQDFSKNMINTLQTGAGNLTLADMNEEAANMVALQTRQSLATSSLSMANQADQNVLQLLR